MKNCIIILFPLLSLIISCGDPLQEINWETQNIPKKIVVEGNITNENGKHPIRLTLTDDYFSDKPATAVSKADVVVSTSNFEMNYMEDPTDPGTYEAESDFIGECGKTYSLTINLKESIDGTTDYTAQSELVKGMDITYMTADLYQNPVQEFDNDSLAIIAIFYGTEPTEYENYYMIKLYKNGDLLDDTITSYNHFSDQSMGINGETAFGMLFHEDYAPGDTFGIELLSIPKDFDQFLDGVDRISEPGDPFGFSGPPANATGNISDGKGLGFFYAAYVSKAQAIVKDMTQQ